MASNLTSALFQVISRNNDPSGNPYRLVIVYDVAGNITERYEARNSSPNICGELRRRGLRELISFHVQPREYLETKRAIGPVDPVD